MAKYRIVPDHDAGFEVQYKCKFWPFWVQCRQPSRCLIVNTHSDIEAAKKFAVDHANGLFKKSKPEIIYLGELP